MPFTVTLHFGSSGGAPARITNANGSPLMVAGQAVYPSAILDETQRELNDFAVLSWQHSQREFAVTSIQSLRSQRGTPAASN
jgi:hypothetical protein